MVISTRKYDTTKQFESGMVIRQRLDRRLLLGGLALFCFLIGGLLAPVLAPFDPTAQDYSSMLARPNKRHVLGTDEFGRDILSRLLWGARVTFAVAVGSVIVAASLGIPVGLLAGYYGGIVDLLVMRATETAMVFPPIVLAMASVALFGSGIVTLIVVIGLIYFPRFARVTYASTLTLKPSTFIEASIAIGASDLRVLTYHILPNVLPPILVQASLAVGFAVLLESGLGFLGLGVQPPNPSWGGMISDARNVMGRSPFYILWPSLFIIGLVLSVNIVGDSLRDKLDPRLRNIH